MDLATDLEEQIAFIKIYRKNRLIDPKYILISEYYNM